MLGDGDFLQSSEGIMGDAADWFDEMGQEDWWAHQRGECDEFCPYCEENLEHEATRQFIDAPEEPPY